MIMKFYLDEGAHAPNKAHEWDAGFDLRTPSPQLIPPNGGCAIDTGVHVEIPHGFTGFLKSKSGLNVEHSLRGEGVIDSEYTGSIVAKIYNDSDVPYFFGAGEKIIQLVILPTPYIEFLEVDGFSETARGNNGFGSTGR